MGDDGESSSADVKQSWTAPAVPILVVIVEVILCLSHDVYALLLLASGLDWGASRYHPFCVVAIALQVPILGLTVWAFLSVVRTPPGRIDREVWQSMPIPAGRAPPSEVVQSILARCSGNGNAGEEPMEQQQPLVADRNPTGPLVTPAAASDPTTTSMMTTTTAIESLPHHPARELTHNQRMQLPLDQLPPPLQVSLDRWWTRNHYLVLQRELKHKQQSEEKQLGIVGESGLRYCTVCDVYKPDFARHCSVCRQCTLCFDHHCPYVNQCIGQHNYTNFLSFLFYGSVCCALHITVGCICVFVVDQRCWREKRWWIFPPALLVPEALFVMSLFVMHTTLTLYGLRSIDMPSASGDGLVPCGRTYMEKQYNSPKDLRTQIYPLLFGTETSWWVQVLLPLQWHSPPPSGDSGAVV